MSGSIERVVVTLDAASENQKSIETAARLAARIKASLHGIFIEDQDLLHLAGLPFACQVTYGGVSHPLQLEDVELHLRAAAERDRHALLASAQRHAIKGSFAVVRGTSTEALAEVGERDLIVAGALTRPVARHFRLECRWWSSIETAHGPILLTQHAWNGAGAIVVLLRDRSAASERLLAAVVQIAEAGTSRLTVICSPALAESRGFEAWLTDRVDGIRLQMEVVPDEPVTLHRLIADLDCRLLVTDAGSAEGRTDRLRNLAERFACDLLIVH